MNGVGRGRERRVGGAGAVRGFRPEVNLSMGGCRRGWREMTQPERTIELDSYLKLKGLVGTGGQAKLLIQAGRVRVNGQVETRRKRKLREGDVVTLDDRSLTVRWDELSR